MKKLLFIILLSPSTLMQAQSIPNFNGYIQQNPINDQILIGMMLQQKYNGRKDWIQQRITQLRNYYENLYNSVSDKSEISGNERNNLNYFWNKLVEYINSISGVDFADDNEFYYITENFKKFQAKLLESYNN